MSRAVGRFAPTPSGPLHLGSLMTALASWLFARSAGGRWLVRIEDLDAARAIPGCAEEQLALLAAFGLVPDGEIVRQSERTSLYDRAFEELRDRGLLYPCRCSRREIASASSAPHGPEGPRYPGTCRSARVPVDDIRAWRFAAPAGEIAWEDAVFGNRREDVAAEVGDFVVRRERPVRAYAYQLAVVVDDAAQGITQVVRGADLLASTSRQIALQRALGLPRPAYAHVPVLVSAIGEKLSKRAGSRQLAEAARAGRTRTILAALLRTLGQEPELGAARAAFDPMRIPRVPEIRLAPHFAGAGASAAYRER